MKKQNNAIAPIQSAPIGVEEKPATVAQSAVLRLKHKGNKIAKTIEELEKMRQDAQALVNSLPRVDAGTKTSRASVTTKEEFLTKWKDQTPAAKLAILRVQAFEMLAAALAE